MKFPIDTHFSREWRIHIVGSAICICVSAGFWFLVFQPASVGRTVDESRQAVLDIHHQKVAALKTALNATKRQTSQSQLELTRRSVTLHDLDFTNQCLAQINDLATSHGLEIENVQAEKPSADAQLARLPIVISGRGSYRNCTLFLHALQEQFADIAVSDLEMNSTSTSEGSGNFVFKMVWYTLPTSESGKTASIFDR